MLYGVFSLDSDSDSDSDSDRDRDPDPDPIALRQRMDRVVQVINEPFLSSWSRAWRPLPLKHLAVSYAKATSWSEMR